MFVDLIRAFCAAVVAIVLPGYFWVLFLRPARGLAERLAYSSALSLATVPVVALLLARITHSGITLWIAVASVVIVLGSGLAAVVMRGAATGPAGPIFTKPPAIRDTRALVLVAVACLAALVLGVRSAPRPGWLILPILALLVLAAVLAASTAIPAAAPAPATVNAAAPARATAPGPAGRRPGPGRHRQAGRPRAGRPGIPRRPARPSAATRGCRPCCTRQHWGSCSR